MRRRHRGPRVICDRTGGKYYMDQCCIEPGTGYVVRKRSSDKQWNIVDHPANHIEKYAKFGDPFPVPNARPDKDWTTTTDIYLLDENSAQILDGNGQPIETD